MSKAILKFCKLNPLILVVEMREKRSKMGQNALKGLKATEIDVKGNFEILQT